MAILIIWRPPGALPPGKARARGGGVTDSASAKSAAAGGAETSAVIAAPAKQVVVKMTFKLKHELETLPQNIVKIEKEIQGLKTRLAEPSFYMRDPEGFDTAAARLAAAERELETAESRWLELEEIRAAL